MKPSPAPRQVSPEEAALILRSGGIVAYPTEGVFGLGCDPFNRDAVHRLLRLKNRPVAQGLILIAGGISDLLPLIKPPLTPAMLEAFNRWPAPRTVLFPPSELPPPWILGQHSTVALRVTAHPLANRVCRLFGQPLVSTSANRRGQPAAMEAEAVSACFGDKIDAIVPGQVLTPGQPSQIVDLAGNTLRQ